MLKNRNLCRNARKKVTPGVKFLPVVSPGSAFLHQCQSGTAGHWLARDCPAILIRPITSKKLTKKKITEHQIQSYTKQV